MSSNVIAIADIGPESGMTKDVFRQMLADADSSEMLELRIDSDGGSVFDGFAMYDDLQAYPGKTKAVVQSAAFSIASFIALACDEVEITPNGYFMIHNPMASTEAGDDEEHASRAKLLANLKGKMIEAYSKRTGKSADEIAQLMKAETFFNAEEALEAGLVDRVLKHERASAVASLHVSRLPHGVFASLSRSGAKQEKSHSKESPEMSEQPVAASLNDIKSACPKASSDFVLKCLERSLPIAQVTAEYSEEQMKAMEELEAENEKLKAQVKAMEEEKEDAEAKAKAMEEEEKAKAEARAKRPGLREPVQQVAASSGESATAKWRSEVDRLVAAGQPKHKAVQAVNRSHPGLREAYLSEVNPVPAN